VRLRGRGQHLARNTLDFEYLSKVDLRTPARSARRSCVGQVLQSVQGPAGREFVFLFGLNMEATVSFEPMLNPWVLITDPDAL
jgi:hypothetical protein